MCGCMCIAFCVVQIIDIGSRISSVEKKMEVFLLFAVWRQNKQSGGNVEIKQETKESRRREGRSGGGVSSIAKMPAEE